MREDKFQEMKGSGKEHPDPASESNIFTTLKDYAPVFKIVILALIAMLAFTVRVFSVIRFESVIHEFDPWFNFRTTKYLAQEGMY